MATWGIVALQSRGRWALANDPTSTVEPAVEQEGPLDQWQSAKGLAVAGALLVIFLFTDWPREVAALAGAGVLLTSRRLHSRKMLGLVDWELLVLFVGLFVVNHAFEGTGVPAALVRDLSRSRHPSGAAAAPFCRHPPRRTSSPTFRRSCCCFT